MAAPKGLLITQLKDKLSNQNEPLDKRLEIAHTVFCSSAIPIAQKEEEILSWILGNIEESCTEKEALYSCLSSCLNSKRIYSFNGNIRPAVINQLLAALDCYDNYSSRLVSAIRECCVSVLSTPFFQRWFMCDVQSACKTGANYFKTIGDSQAFSDFPKVVKQLLHIQRLSLLKAEFRIHFIKEVIRPMCSAMACIPSENRQLSFHDATILWREILFYEPKFIESYINSNLSNHEECTEDVKRFKKKLKHFPMKAGKDVVDISYSLFLRAVISKHPDSFNKIFRVFTFLCPPLGIIVDRIISIEMVPIPGWDIENSFCVIKSLVDILDDSKIPLTCNLEEVSLQNWFTSLVIGLTNIISRTMSIEFFEMVRRVYEFNPLVIEPSCKIITLIMLRKKSDHLKPAYVSLISSVIKGSAKLQRLQKFVSFFLENMKNHLRTSCEDDLILEDVLPSEVCEEFSKAIALLPTAQVLSITKSFLFHLQRDCLNDVECSQTDVAVIINVEVISALLNMLLRSTNIIHHSVPDVVKTKYKHLLEELQSLLKLFGIAYQDLHDDRLLKSYLMLCRAFGRIKLLFREYDGIQIVKPMDVDLEPTNISYVHNYLHPDNWKAIAESIEEHENCMARYEMFELLVQKVEAVSQVEEGYEGPGTQAARYLLQHSDIDWLWSKILTLAPLFQSAELVKLVSKSIRHFADDQTPWLPLLKEDSFTENRRLVLAVEFGLLSRSSKKIYSDKDDEECLSRQVLSLISVEEVLEFELSQLITEDDELRENVEGFIGEMAALLNENLLVESTCQKVPHTSFFEVPARLPVHYLSGISQSCALLSAIALLHDLPPGSESDMLLFNLVLKILNGPQKGNICLLSRLNPGTLLQFVVKRGAGYRGQRKLLKKVCSLAFLSKKTARQLFSAVDDPNPSNVWLTVLVLDCLIQLKKKFIGNEDCKKPLQRKKCVEHLLGEVMPIVSSTEPSPQLLYSYSILLNYTVRYLPALGGRFTVLLPLLQGYVSLALSNYGEGERLVEGMIEHRTELGEYFPSTLVESTFELMSSHLVPPTESFAHQLFVTATPSEFSSIVSSLLLRIKEKEFEEDSEKCRRTLLLWTHLASVYLSSEKGKERDKALSQLLQLLVSISTLWASGSALHLVQPFMALLAVISQNLTIVLNSITVDTMMVLISEVPVGEDPERIVSHLSAVVDGMLTMYLYRVQLLLDRLPPFLQRYRTCLLALAKVVSPSSSFSFIRKAVPVAEKLHRLATVMIKKSREYSRIAPYMISNIMSIFQNYNLPSEVKFWYTDIANAFLSLSDNYAVDFLKASLPTGQQELFNGVYENYKKFHRYGGKV